MYLSIASSWGGFKLLWCRLETDARAYRGQKHQVSVKKSHTARKEDTTSRIPHLMSCPLKLIWGGDLHAYIKNQGVWWAQQLQLTLTGGKLLPLNEIFRFRRPIAILRWPSITAALAILSALFNHFLIKCQVSFFWNIFTLSTCLAAFGTKMIDTLQNSPQLSSTRI